MQSLADELRAEFPGIASEQPRLTASIQILCSGFWRAATLTITDRAAYAAWIERGALRCLSLTERQVEGVSRSRHWLSPAIEVSLNDPDLPSVFMRSRRRPPLSAAGWGVRVAESDRGVDLNLLERTLRTTLAV